MPEENDRILTPQQVAELFGVTPQTVRDWTRTGKLRYFRTPGRHRRILLSDALQLKAATELDGAA